MHTAGADESLTREMFCTSIDSGHKQYLFTLSFII